jgi:glycosyltransferase involved in cell wall biosynthesis
LRVCLVYDCLFPWTVGGAERWLRGVGERLAAAGHDVTYLTLRQWERGERPELPGVRVVAVGPRLALYTPDGRRRIGPPLVFGAGVLAHLARHGRAYDVVHTASFPFFSVLAAAALRPLHGFRLVVDWHEVWTRAYWRTYLGPAGGAVGALVQRLCARVPQRAFCFSRLHAARLAREGLRGEVTLLEGEYAGPLEPRAPRPAEEHVVFAGRHIPEKRVEALVPALARAREALPGLRGTLFGDGPTRPAVVAAIVRRGAQGWLRAPGFVGAGEVEAALATALCLVLPSEREGYGMVVIEASALGTPSVVVAGEDNAAVEHVEEGVNGTVAPSASPEDLAAAIRRVAAGGDPLRASTAAWFARHARRLSLDASLERVLAAYAAASARR